MIKTFIHAIIISVITTTLIGLIAISIVPVPTPIHLSKELSESEIKSINHQLLKMCADDCILEPTNYGYKCKEIKTGKVYRIKKI